MSKIRNLINFYKNLKYFKSKINQLLRLLRRLLSIIKQLNLFNNINNRYRFLRINNLKFNRFIFSKIIIKKIMQILFLQLLDQNLYLSFLRFKKKLFKLQEIKHFLKT